MSDAISWPGRIWPACMAIIGAMVISAHATMTNSKTPAVAFLAMLIYKPARLKHADK